MHAVIAKLLAPLMTEPRDDCERADEALLGWSVELLTEREHGWYRVRTHYRYEGWVQADCLLCGDAAAEAWAHLPKMVVLAPFCDVLLAPEVQSGMCQTLTRGALISPVGLPTSGGWQEVRLPSGACGFTKIGFLGEHHSAVPPCTEEDLRARVAATALTYLGAAYRWGGKTPAGIDCSGLTAMAYLLNGVLIYRDAHIKEGFPLHEIARAEMKKADLLFFPGHVALYLGDGKFLHSTAKNGSDGVVVNSLNPTDADYRADLDASMTAVGSIF